MLVLWVSFLKSESIQAKNFQKVRQMTLFTTTISVIYKTCHLEPKTMIKGNSDRRNKITKKIWQLQTSNDGGVKIVYGAKFSKLLPGFEFFKIEFFKSLPFESHAVYSSPYSLL